MKISIPKQEYEIAPEDLNAVEKFLSSIIPGFIKEFSGALQDSVKGWRARNMVNILVKTKEKVEVSGLTLQELSGKFMVQALEKGSVENDKTLQDKWATLLANTSTGKNRASIKYINMLSELDVNEVRLLDILYTELLQNEEDNEYVFSTEKAAKAFGVKVPEIKLMVDNFYRMNICQSPAMTSISAGGGAHPILKTNNLFTFTDLGKDFLAAVRND